MAGNEAAPPRVGQGVLELCLRTGALLLAGVALGFAVNAARPDGVALSNFAPPVTCAAGGATDTVLLDAPPVKLVSQSEATLLCADGSTLIADVRSAEAFAAGHVANAIHLPCSASDKVADAAETGLVKKRLLLVYGARTDDALAVAEEMRQRLHRRDLAIGVLEGGFSAWSEAGLACTSGTCPQCGALDHAGHTP